MIDAIVIGGGPAGSVAAHLLATWGHVVTLLQRPRSAGRSLAESLPPSTLTLLDKLGLGGPVGAAGFLRSHGNSVCWGGGDLRSEPFPDGTFGYQVRRDAFDAVLLSVAEGSGSRVLRGIVAERVEFEADVGDGTRQVTVACEPLGASGNELRGRFVLDCSGRTGVIARQGWRVQSDRQRSVALVGVWASPTGWGLPDESHTVVEAYADGWAWSVPVSASHRYVTMMVTPGVTDLRRGEGLEAAYRSELAKTRHLRGLVERGRPDGPIWSCDASLYSARRYADGHVLLVGDAASFIEPLSSFGVKKALASGWLAAVAVHTSLTDPAMREVALEFFSARERLMHASYDAQSARFFREVAAATPSAFWSDRFAVTDEVGAGTAPGDGPDLEALRRDTDVLGALAALKRASGISLRPTGQLRLARRAAVEGRRIVLEDRIVEPELDGATDGIRFLRGIDLPRLIAMAPECGQVPDLFEAYNRTSPPVALPDFLGALAVLLGKGFVENTARSRRSPE